MIRIDMKGARLIALFLLGVFLFNYPILSLFNRPIVLFGIPVLYLYIFVIWALIILLVGLVTQLSSVLKLRATNRTEK